MLFLKITHHERLHYLRGLFCLLLLAVLSPVGAEQVVRFGTGGSDGSYFPVGSIIAKEINIHSAHCCADDPLLVLPQRSNGSVSNIKDLSENLLEVGLAQADVVSLANQGIGLFEGNNLKSTLRTIGTLLQESVHLVVSVDSGIESVADLNGKRVSVDELGSGTQFDADLILKASDMPLKDVKLVYLKPTDSIERLRRGQLDAFFGVSAYPVSGVQQLVDDGVGRVVSLGDDLVDRLAREHLYFSAQSIPPNIYSNTEAINTVSVSAQMIVRSDVSDDAVYEITSMLWSDATLDALAEGHPRGVDILAERALQGVVVPIHPGALRYYEERGYDLSGLPR